MHTIPKALKDTLTATIVTMCAAYGIEKHLVDAGCLAMLTELNGKGSKSITNREPLDRVLSRAQAADVCACSKKAISEKVKRGVLRGIYGGKDGKRLTGISEASLRAYMEGSAK